MAEADSIERHATEFFLVDLLGSALAPPEEETVQRPKQAFERLIDRAGPLTVGMATACERPIPHWFEPIHLVSESSLLSNDGQIEHLRQAIRHFAN